MTTSLALRPDYAAARARDHETAVRALARAALCVAVGREYAELALTERGWGDDRLAYLIIRAPVNPTDRVAADALARVAYAFLESLGVISAGAALLARALSVQLAGASEVIIPRVAPGVASFASEGRPLPLMQLQTSGPKMTGGYKLVALIGATNELLRLPDADEALRVALTESAAVGLDAIMFDDQSIDAADPIVASRPAGLRWNVPAIPASGAATTLDAMLDDVEAVARAVANVAVSAANIVLIAAVPQSVSLTLRPIHELPYPMFATTGLPDGTLMAVATNAIACSVGAPQFDAPTHASMHMATDPAEIVDRGGVVAASVRSGFQTDSSGIRLRQGVTWVPRVASGAVAWVTGTKW